MRFLVPILAFTLIIAGCQKDNNEDIGDLNGMYSGTFHRTGMDTTDVTLSFFKNSFEGQSSREKYPAICRGSFDVDDNTITFVDSCTWTADFDWSLILNGTWNISFRQDNSLRLWRNNGIVTDEYILTRRQR
jgi:hypothetical protein